MRLLRSGSGASVHAKAAPRLDSRTASFLCLLLALLVLLGAAMTADAPRAQPDAADETASAPALPGPAVVMDQALDRDQYRLGPGDQLLLVLEGKNRRRFPLTVLPSGVLDWEGGLHLNVGGFSLAEAERRVAAALGPYMPDVNVNLLLLEPRLIEVYVIGEVETPISVELRASDRISKALQKAGGPLPSGSSRFVELLTDTGERERLDLYPFLMAGDWSANPYCPADRVLFIPVRKHTVELVGEINRPGIYEWREGETLGDFLDYAQGFTNDALMESIVLERDETEVTVQLIDPEERDLSLRPSDVLVVGSRKPLMNRVFLEGAGERRGEVYLSDGETLGDLVRRLGDTRGRAMPEQAVLERKGTERSEFFRVNLKEVYAGEGPVDMPILNDDVLYVPIRRFDIFVLGEVEAPGAQSYLPSMTVGQYIALAAGTTSKGSWSKLKVIDSDGNERKVKRSDNLHRGDVLFVGKSRFSIFSDVLLTAVSLSAIVLAIAALAK